jgi:uncharacterized protein (TIGR04222 family)
MWPFDLRGPEFLLFYLAVSVVVVVASILLRHSAEPADTPKINLSDPNLIAYLRGGKNEVLRVVTISLVDRCLLVATGTKLTACEGAFGKAQSEVERKVVRHFNPSAEAATIFKMKDVDPEMSQYAAELTRLGLLTDEAEKETQKLRMAIALALLLGIAIFKLMVALATGHRNVGFLILLAVLDTIAVVIISRPRLTKAGQRMLDDLRTLFGGLRARSEQIQNGASPAEFALMAAVFGTATIPSAKKMFPQAGSGGCGSSCGSGGDGGGGCGGGGCGGCGG